MKHHKKQLVQASRRHLSIILVLVITVIGTLILLITHAATTSLSIEPEDGSRSQNAKLLNNVANASNSSAVKFTKTSSGAGNRDAFQWPFSKYSIWNMPIGDGADYQPANLDGDLTNIDPDLSLIVQENSSISSSVRWFDDGYTWDYDGRCTSLGDNDAGQGYNTGKSWKISIPQSTAGYFSKGGNNHVSIYKQDLSGRFDMEAAAICDGGSTLGGGSERTLYDVNGKGEAGGQGGSGLPNTGGAIRKPELTSGVPINHALGMILEGWRYLQKCNAQGGGANDAFRWPAQKADAYACVDGNHGGYGKFSGSMNKDYFRMGSLLAVPPANKPGGVNLATNQLGLQTEMGKKIAAALQNFGAYVDDDSYGSPGDFNSSYMGFKVSIDALDQWRSTNNNEILLEEPDSAVAKDIKKILPTMKVVANNHPNSIGGPGTRIACYAPPFSNLTDAITTNPNTGNPGQPSSCP